MTNKEKDSNKYSFKHKLDFNPKKPEQKSKLIVPSFVNPQATNFSSNFSEKDNNIDERNKSSCSYKSGIEFDMTGQSFLPYQHKYMPPHLFNFPFTKSRIFNVDENNNNIKFNSKNIILNCIANDQDIYKDKNEEKKNNNKIFQKNINNNYNLYNLTNKNIDLNDKNWKPEKNINLNLNVKINLNNTTNNNNINNSKTKFFTNHNYGYKCSCSKTQCNRKYCECFNSGNYCIDCNCKNCNNKPPMNSYTNKHPTDDSLKNKKEKIICTCTKSGCNKNYCECFKNAQKCSEWCRCIICENNDEITNKKNNNNNYECCPANSIYIIKNKISIENIQNRKSKNEDIKNNFDLFPIPVTKENYITISKKRKREEIKKSEQNCEKGKNIDYNFGVFDLFNDSEFDKNGKFILRHINIIHM